MRCCPVVLYTSGSNLPNVTEVSLLSRRLDGCAPSETAAAMRRWRPVGSSGRQRRRDPGCLRCYSRQRICKPLWHRGRALRCLHDSHCRCCGHKRLWHFHRMMVIMKSHTCTIGLGQQSSPAQHQSPHRREQKQLKIVLREQRKTICVTHSCSLQSGPTPQFQSRPLDNPTENRSSPY